MGAQLKQKRQETTKLAARSRWKAGGLLAKQKLEQQKQAAQGLDNKVLTGAMAHWKWKAAEGATGPGVRAPSSACTCWLFC